MISFRNEDMRLTRSEKTEILGTKVSQFVFFFVFYSVCNTKQTDHGMNAFGDSMNWYC